MNSKKQRTLKMDVYASEERDVHSTLRSSCLYVHTKIAVDGARLERIEIPVTRNRKGKKVREKREKEREREGERKKQRKGHREERRRNRGRPFFGFFSRDLPALRLLEHSFPLFHLSLLRSLGEIRVT